VRQVEEEEAGLLVHVVGHEGARKPGNGSDGELGPQAMADAVLWWFAMHVVENGGGARRL